MHVTAPKCTALITSPQTRATPIRRHHRRSTRRHTPPPRSEGKKEAETRKTPASHQVSHLQGKHKNPREAIRRRGRWRAFSFGFGRLWCVLVGFGQREKRVLYLCPAIPTEDASEALCVGAFIHLYLVYRMDTYLRPNVLLGIGLGLALFGASCGRRLHPSSVLSEESDLTRLSLQHQQEHLQQDERDSLTWELVEELLPQPHPSPSGSTLPPPPPRRWRGRAYRHRIASASLQQAGAQRDSLRSTSQHQQIATEPSAHLKTSAWSAFVLGGSTSLLLLLTLSVYLYLRYRR